MTDLSKEADTLGYAALIPASRERLLHNQRVGKILKRSDAADLGFLYWVMRSQAYRNEVLASATGSTVKHTSPTKILAFQFPCPPLGEQRAIASVLRALDEKIDLNHGINDTIEAMARAIFKDWFVDFGPTRAKIEGRAPYLPLNLWDLFPSKLDGNGTPVGWRVSQWDEIATLEYGKALRGYEGVAGQFPVYGTNGRIGWHDKPLCERAGTIIGRKGAYRGVHLRNPLIF